MSSIKDLWPSEEEINGVNATMTPYDIASEYANAIGERYNNKIKGFVYNKALSGESEPSSYTYELFTMAKGMYYRLFQIKTDKGNYPASVYIQNELTKIGDANTEDELRTVIANAIQCDYVKGLIKTALLSASAQA